jgi:phosphoglucosamine mutase
MLPQHKVVGTIMTNMGVENYLNSHGITLVRTQVGDRYIIEKMRAEDIKMGGEPSGHIIFSRHTTTGDGLIAALQVVASVVKSGRKLSELVADIPLYPQVQTKIHVKEKRALEDVPQLLDAIKKTEDRLNKLGRAVVRFSGTEPVLRLMIEGQDQKKIQAELEELTKIAATNLS